MKLLRYGPPGGEKPGLLDASGAIRDLSAKYSVMQGAMAALERIFNLLDTREQLPEAPAAAAVTPPRPAQRIEFRDICFAYNGDADVLKQGPSGEHLINRLQAGDSIGEMALFDRLVERWPDATIVPSLAERWEIADDEAFGGKQRELVAQDYVYSFKRFYDAKWKSANLYLLENAKIVGMSELRKKALADKDKPFPYDTEVEGLRVLDREQRVLSREGALIRIVPPQLTAEERAEKEAKERAAAEAPGVRLRFVPKPDKDSAPLRAGGVDELGEADVLVVAHPSRPEYERTVPGGQSIRSAISS